MRQTARHRLVPSGPKNFLAEGEWLPQCRGTTLRELVFGFCLPHSGAFGVHSHQTETFAADCKHANDGGDHFGRLQGSDHCGRVQIRKHRTARDIADARLQSTSVISGPGTADNIVFLAEDRGAYLPRGGKRAGGRAGGGEPKKPHNRGEENGESCSHGKYRRELYLANLWLRLASPIRSPIQISEHIKI